MEREGDEGKGDALERCIYIGRVEYRSQAGACALATGGCVPPVQVCMRIIGIVLQIGH